MKTIILNIELLSDTLPGSGEGYGAVIDTDIVFDEYGIPFIPARRIKGCLKDSANEIIEMLTLANNNHFSNSQETIKDLFGMPGQSEENGFQFYNLYPKEYNQTVDWFKYLNNNYSEIFSKEAILESYTDVRMQTRIDDEGIADDHSLRTIRVIRKGLTFEGEIKTQIPNADSEFLLELACANLRRIGTKRNRGLGEVKCSLNGSDIKDKIQKLKTAGGEK